MPLKGFKPSRNEILMGFTMQEVMWEKLLKDLIQVLEGPKTRGGNFKVDFFLSHTSPNFCENSI